MTEVIIILGCSIRNLSGVVPPMMLMRLQKALEVINEYRRNGIKFVVIVSGGGSFSVNGHSESRLMKKWLIDNGVNERLIIEENRSMNTIENAAYTANIFRYMWEHPTYDGGLNNLCDDETDEVISLACIEKGVLITSDFHVERSKLLFDYYLPEIDLIGVGANTPADEIEQRKAAEFYALYETKKSINQMTRPFM